MKSAHCDFVICFHMDIGIPRVLSLQLFSYFIPLSLLGLLNKQNKGEYFCFWRSCLKIMGVTKWWGEMSEVVGVEEASAVRELHVPGPAWLLSKVLLLKYCNNLNGEALSSLICIFFAIKNLAFCPPWMWGKEKAAAFYVFEICCVFFSLSWTVLRVS